MTISYAGVRKDPAAGEWTHVSDVGKPFGGRVLTSIEYAAFENSMASVVLALLLENAVSELLLVKEDDDGKIVAEEPVTSLHVAEIVRGALRDEFDLDVRLEHERCFVHPDFDTNIFLGSEAGFGRVAGVARFFGVAFRGGVVSPRLLSHAEEFGAESFRPWPRIIPDDVC